MCQVACRYGIAPRMSRTDTSSSPLPLLTFYNISACSRVVTRYLLSHSLCLLRVYVFITRRLSARWLLMLISSCPNNFIQNH